MVAVRADAIRFCAKEAQGNVLDGCGYPRGETQIGQATDPTAASAFAPVRLSRLPGDAAASALHPRGRSKTIR